MSLLPEPAPDFTDPIGLLRACHERILKHCELLERMQDWLPRNGADSEIRQGARGTMRYFETAARHHHADEEQDLFPLLDGIDALATLLDALRRDHRRLEAAWDTIAPHLRTLADGDVPDGFDNAVRDFVAAYRDHVQIENGQLLPMAQRVLSAGQARALGEAMARRRGVSPKAED